MTRKKERKATNGMNLPPRNTAINYAAHTIIYISKLTSQHRGEWWSPIELVTLCVSGDTQLQEWQSRKVSRHIESYVATIFSKLVFCFHYIKIQNKPSGMIFPAPCPSSLLRESSQTSYLYQNYHSRSYKPAGGSEGNELLYTHIHTHHLEAIIAADGITE